MVKVRAVGDDPLELVPREGVALDPEGRLHLLQGLLEVRHLDLEVLLRPNHVGVTSYIE